MNFTEIELLDGKKPSRQDDQYIPTCEPTVVLHAVHHLLLNHALELALVEEGGDAGPDLADEDEREEDGVGVDHAAALLVRAAAPKEGHNKDDAT